MSLPIFRHASNDPEVHLRAHRTLTQKIAFDHHKAKPIDGYLALRVRKLDALQGFSRT